MNAPDFLENLNPQNIKDVMKFKNIYFLKLHDRESTEASFQGAITN